jgi:hypothetical protein
MAAEIHGGQDSLWGGKQGAGHPAADSPLLEHTIRRRWRLFASRTLADAGATAAAATRGAGARLRLYWAPLSTALIHLPDSLLKTALIGGVRVAKIDSTITGNLLLDHVTVAEARQETLIIGIRNEAGEIYRIIGADKLASYLNAVEELVDLELVDELQEARSAKDGYDSIFRSI